MPDPQPIPGADAHAGGMFATTQWSVIRRAGDVADPQHSDALSELCRRYWRPLFLHSRRLGASPEEAADLVQGFIARVVAENLIHQANPERGTFRTFLLSSFRNFSRSEWRRDNAQKRGGGMAFLSLDDVAEADAEFLVQSRGAADPEREFDRAWASTVLHTAFANVRQSFCRRGLEPIFEALEPHLLADVTALTLEDLAQRTQRPVGTLKSDLFRLRSSLREAIRKEIADTVDDEAAFKSELEHFRQLFSRP